MAGPEVTIPFGALVEPAGADRDREKFRYLGELYSVRADIFLAATKADEVEPAPAEAPAAARAAVGPEAPAKPTAKEARLKFERLDAGGYSAARAKVPGGWLVACGAGVTFYPDPLHEWDGASPE